MSEAVINEEILERPKKKKIELLGFDFSWADPVAIKNSPAFYPALALIAAFTILFWNLFKGLPKLYLENEYYSHGWIVPALSIAIIAKHWDKFSKIPVQGSWIPILFLIPFAMLNFAATRIQQLQFISLSFVFTMLLGVWFIAGFRWMLALSLPISLTLFMLPVFSAMIDSMTNPLQLISTEISYGMLQFMQLSPFKENATTIQLSNFTLDVGVPCSGLKTLLAITCFTLFFTMYSKRKWWGNLSMLMAVVPLCLFINGLRIAMIGVVGNSFGPDAGHKFHDYSGIIGLVICFIILFKFAQLLGWKD